MLYFIRFIQIASLSLLMPQLALSANKVAAHEIVYDEKEESTDFYKVKFTVTENFIRIDDSSEAIDDSSEDTKSSGFIVFDIKEQVIYSVSHFDEAILVIPKYTFDEPKLSNPPVITYEKMVGAPSISGKPVFSYKVVASEETGEKTCMDIKLAEGLLQDVALKIRQYQLVVAGQLVKNIITIPEEFRTQCYMIDQVYNDGKYYLKGLPIHEQHNNNKFRILKSMNETMVDPVIFDLPKGYNQYRLDEVFQ